MNALDVVSNLCDFALEKAPSDGISVDASLWASGCDAHAKLKGFIEATMDYHEALSVYDMAEQSYGALSNCRAMREARVQVRAAVKRYIAAEAAVRA